MKVVHSVALVDNTMSVILLENNFENDAWKELASEFINRNMVITDVPLGSTMRIIKIIHRRDSSFLANALHSMFHGERHSVDDQLSSLMPHLNDQDGKAIQNVLSSHCNHFEFVNKPFTPFPVTENRDEWIIVPSSADTVHVVEFLTETQLFLEELAHRIRRTIHVDQSPYNACKDLPQSMRFPFSSGKNNTFATSQPVTTIDLESFLHVLSRAHEQLRQIIDITDFFYHLGRMQFYCYWLGHQMITESVVLSVNPLRAIISRGKVFYNPLSNVILLNTYHTVESILKEQNDTDVEQMLDESWDAFKNGLHVEAARLQQLLEEQDVRKELTFLLKAYQRLLRFPVNDLERMFKPSTWFKAF